MGRRARPRPAGLHPLTATVAEPDGPRWRRRAHLVTALVAGLLLTAALPPFGWWPLAPVGVALLDRALAGRSRGGRFAVGWWTGIGWLGVGIYWFGEFSLPGWILAAMLESVFIGAAMVLVPPDRGRRIALPLAMVVGEMVRWRIPFGGEPLATMAIGQAGGPLVAVARLGGALGVTAVVCLIGVGLSALTDGLGPARPGITAPAQRLSARSKGVAALVGAAAVTAVATAWPLGPVSRTITVAAVQGGGQRGLRAVDSDPRDVFDRHLAAARELERGDVDLVVWPENVVDTDTDLRRAPERRELEREAQRVDALLEVGVTSPGPDGLRFENLSAMFDSNGELLDTYEKNIRVPFGEYVPFRSIVKHLGNAEAVPHDAIPGKGPGVLRTPIGPMAIGISYEVFFAERASSGVRRGGQLVLIPTNASSFTTSQLPTQQLAAAKVLAVTTGRATVLAGPTGLSAIIDEDGRVLRRSTLERAEVLRSEVRMRQGITPAVLLGEGGAAQLAALALAGQTIVRRRRDRPTSESRHTADAPPS